MKVIYIKGSNKHFTNGKVYEVVEIDQDGDYVLVDDNGDKINHYKSFFEIVE